MRFVLVDQQSAVNMESEHKDKRQLNMELSCGLSSWQELGAAGRTWRQAHSYWPFRRSIKYRVA